MAPEVTPPPSDDSAMLDAWLERLDLSSYYELLGLLEIATEEAVRDGFHEFSLGFHPDLHRHRPADQQRAVTRIFQRGSEAYRVLMDPEERRRYDLALRQGRLRLGTGDGLPDSTPLPEGAPLRLEQLAHSAAARLAAHRAEGLLEAGDYRGAKKELQLALYHDADDNAPLAERLEAIEDLLFASGL